jgi:hypothetical protein
MRRTTYLDGDRPPIDSHNIREVFVLLGENVCHRAHGQQGSQLNRIRTLRKFVGKKGIYEVIELWRVELSDTWRARDYSICNQISPSF